MKGFHSNDFVSRHLNLKFFVGSIVNEYGIFVQDVSGQREAFAGIKAAGVGIDPKLRVQLKI